MNNHKTLWKISTFKWTQILLCIVPFFVPTWSTITFDEDDIRIFAHNAIRFESEVFKSLHETKNFFASPKVEAAIKFGRFFAPVSEIMGMISYVRDLLTETSDWRGQFSNSIVRVMNGGTASNQAHVFESDLKEIASKIESFTNENANHTTRESLTLDFHYKIDTMLNYFDEKNSPFRELPLIGTPLLIALAQLIAYFEPMVKAIDPELAKTPSLSCKMLTIVQDYLPRAVNARLEKLRLTSTKLDLLKLRLKSSKLSENLYYAMSREYNQSGYRKKWLNKRTKTINCEICDESVEGLDSTCLKDDFGDDKFGCFPTQFSVSVPCMRDYALLLRHRVEQLFPIQLLETLCNDPPERTAFGWLTIKLKDVRARLQLDGLPCDAILDDCDVFVKLFINGKLQFETKALDCCYDVNVTHISEEISESSLVKIEVWDSDDFLFIKRQPTLVLTTEGNFTSFQTIGHRGVYIHMIPQSIRPGYGFGPNYSFYKENYIETVSFWQYKYNLSDAKKPL